MKTIIFISVLIASLSTSCDTGKTDNTNTMVQEEKILSETDVPFTIAERYFVNNTVENIDISLKITSKEDFDKYFGMAATMGNNGIPTPIDFSTQYVIAVIDKKSDNLVTILPESLISDNGTITFRYKTEEKEKQTFTSRALLILIVNKDYNGNIEFKKG